jgi:hypothetical protein
MEGGANTPMTRWRGRAPGGQRLLARIPHGSYQTSTLISGLRLEGPCALWLFEGPMNGEMFLAWVAQALAPTLRTGDLVILDNLATHKIRGVREAIQAQGARLLYLPPYFSRLQSHRTDVEQEQANPPQSCSENGNRSAPGSQNGLPSHLRHRQQELLF